MIANDKQKNNLLLKILAIRELVLVGLIAIIWIILAITVPIFLNPSNIKAILIGLSGEVIIAIGMTNVLVSGGFDLSVGSILALAGVVTCLSIKAGIPVFISIIFGILTGSIIGLINGYIITKWKINPFITTLGMMSIARGFVLIFATGATIIDLPKVFTNIGQGNIMGVQLPIIIALMLIIIGDIFLRKSRFFRQSYYIGSNEKAASLTGISVDKIKIISYILVGTLAAFSGVLTSARFAYASVNVGTGLELKVITSCIIGGASLGGGTGSIVGAFLGTLLMATIVNGLNLIGVNVYWQNVLTGVVLIGAVLFDTILKEKGKAGYE
jgi:ribose transport system permease protein